MNVERNVPKRRFAGFNDVWEQQSLFNIVGRTYGGGTPSALGPDYWNGDIPWIQSSNLTEDMLFNIEVKRYISEDGIIHSASQIVPKNSIAVVTHVGVGKLAFIPYRYSTSQDFISLSELKCNPVFLCYSLYKKLQNDLYNVQGSAIKGISKSDLMEKKLFIPRETEQQKIGAFFSSLDKLIILHQRKCEKLKALKQAYLSEMFPAPGERYPKRRFAGFTDAWKQCALSQLVDEFKSGEAISAHDIVKNGRYPVFGGNGLRGYTNCYNHDGDYALIGRQGALCGNITYSFGKAYFTEHAIAVHANKNNTIRFLYYLLGVMNLGQYSGQSAQPGLAVNRLIKLETLVPRYAEQQKIGAFFSALDDSIALHQRKCEKLKALKQAYLSEMFV